MTDAINTVITQLKNMSGGYVCFTNVHATVMARENKDFLAITNESFMSLPDGKPVYWVGKLKGYNGLEQIPGPDFLPKLLATKTVPPLRHYFYGGTQEVIDNLVKKVKINYPAAEIVGAESPPFRKLSKDEVKESLQCMRDAKPDFIWVGLGAPKQEIWMAKHWQELKPAILFGVGAAFDFHAGTIQRAPRWAQKLGLEWLHRLSQEPGRLWKRYFYTNSMFVLYLLRDLFSKHS
ncbi:MAG: WecB/TagA/CpsF family glycosyltransferase [Kangiella sp.]|nr:WecB/TagA/CpsF family glycosyltransferase [Kangiella sp.]